MLSRRSIFSLFSAGVAIAAGAKVVVAAPLRGPRVWINNTNYELEEALRRMGSTGVSVDTHSHVSTITDPTHSHSISPALNAGMSRW